MSLWGTLRALWNRRRYEADLDDEMRFHLQARAAELEQAGVPAGEALRRARVEFGGWESHKHEMREALGTRLWDELTGDLRYALRTLRNSPAFSLVAIGSLALAIGANTNIFSVANELLYLQLRVPRPQELRILSVAGAEPSVAHSTWGSSQSEGGRVWIDSIPYPAFKQLQAQSKTMPALAGYKDIGVVNVLADGVASSHTAHLVSGNFYGVMETQPALGRGILPSDEGGAGVGSVAVLSDRYWKTAFGGRGDAIGKAIRVNGNSVTIVGVNAPGFTGAASTTSSPDLFLPISLMPRLRASYRRDTNFIDSPEVWWVSMVARARPGVPDAEAASELSVLLERSIRAAGPVKQGEHIPHVQVDNGSRGVRFFDEKAKPLHVLLALTGLVLLLACANIANLLLARTIARMREMSVRMALGASRGRILRQVLTESLLLAGLGGALGLLLGYAGRNALVKLYIGRSYAEQPIEIHFDWRVFCVTAAATIGTGLLFGTLPAWRATRGHGGVALKGESRTSTRRRGTWTGKLLLSFQLAISTFLVAGAALFVRTLWNLDHVDPGFPTEHLVEFDIAAPNQRYTEPQAKALMATLQDKLRGLPGMGQLAVAAPALLDNSQWSSDFEVEGAPKPKPNEYVVGLYAMVSPGFLKVMGIPLLRGRDLAPADTMNAAHVAVINKSAAAKFFPGKDPIGRRFSMGDGPDPKQGRRWVTVVGICADTEYANVRGGRVPLHFDPLAQSQGGLGGGTFVVRTATPVAELLPMVQRAVSEVDGELPVMDMRTLDEEIADSLRQERLIATLTAGFGFLALLLASVGIYGLMAYTVTQRTNEIGLRLALGAQRGQVRTAVLREVGVLTLGGAGAGALCVVAAVRLLRGVLYDTAQGTGLLFGLRGVDPPSLVIAGGVLLTVALLAAWIPAARASRVEPMQALRHD